MNWKQYITDLNSTESDTKYAFNSPTPYHLLDDLQIQFGLEELPGELIELYKETNGIDEMLNGEKSGKLIWTVETVIEENKTYREHQDFKELYMSFDQLLFLQMPAMEICLALCRFKTDLTEMTFLFGTTRMTVEPG